MSDMTLGNLLGYGVGAFNKYYPSLGDQAKGLYNVNQAVAEGIPELGYGIGSGYNKIWNYLRQLGIDVGETATRPTDAQGNVYDEFPAEERINPMMNLIVEAGRKKMASDRTGEVNPFASTNVLQTPARNPNEPVNAAEILRNRGMTGFTPSMAEAALGPPGQVPIDAVAGVSKTDAVAGGAGGQGVDPNNRSAVIETLKGNLEGAGRWLANETNQYFNPITTGNTMQSRIDSIRDKATGIGNKFADATAADGGIRGTINRIYRDKVGDPARLAGIGLQQSGDVERAMQKFLELNQWGAQKGQDFANYMYSRTEGDPTIANPDAAGESFMANPRPTGDSDVDSVSSKAEAIKRAVTPVASHPTMNIGALQNIKRPGAFFDASVEGGGWFTPQDYHSNYRRFGRGA